MTETPDLDLPDLDLFGAETIETPGQPTPRQLRHAARHRAVAGLKRQALAELVSEPPAVGEYVHIVSNGRFDYFTFVSLILGWADRVDHLWGSTWTMNRANVGELLALFDAGKIGAIVMVTGLYFMKREAAVAATLIEGLHARGQRFKAWENHAKVLCMADEMRGDYYVVEGSANWTANPRTEQNLLANSRALYDFHTGWMKEMLDRGKTNDKRHKD